MILPMKMRYFMFEWYLLYYSIKSVWNEYMRNNNNKYNADVVIFFLNWRPSPMIP